MLVSEGEETKKASALEEAIQGLDLLEEAFTKYSKGQKFFGGDKIGYVDIAFGSYLGWVRVIQKMANASLIDESKIPNLFKWAKHFCADDAVKDVLPETEKLLEFAKVLVPKLKVVSDGISVETQIKKEMDVIHDLCMTYPLANVMDDI
ncbi:hypothetical protein BUALT_Bualt17G0059300 [Buddleja alternifolia]|uniref:glutathione transferase n=1 Tax=Buddleja alternifolia TaxID=168488 RepID=A0AAV6W807_9LAMI|nr:hypothetical protein BUALT_Bualt17G0059300 [Buddleja alternifolia]